jgi:uncharacterized protein (TIGR03084 family)
VTEGRDVFADLVAEGDEVDRMVAGLTPDQWALPTPAAGWTIAHQVAHLAATFRMAGLAAAEPGAFVALVSRLSDDFDANVRMALSSYLAEPPEVLLQRWRTERATAEVALGSVYTGQLVPWLVRAMPASILAAAGMTELFGHGQDIADTLGITRVRTDRLRHIVAFAVRTWDFGYATHGIATPDIEMRFEVTAPSGARWHFGPAASPDRVSGPAEDFCLLVTRRRHHADLALVASGDEAERWLDIAQAYRGPAGTGRTPTRVPAAVGQ